MIRRPTGSGLVAGAVVLAVAVGLGGCLPDGDPPPSAADSLAAPEQVTAGSSIEVVVEGDGPGSIDLHVVDAFATTTLTAPVDDGRAVFTLPDRLTELRGLLSFRAQGSTGGAVAGSTRIVPASPSDPIDIAVGPRTVVADGADQTMVTAIAVDAFGNPLPDGTVVTIERIGDDGTSSTASATVDGGLAALLVGSATTAQRIEAFASLDGVSSRRVAYHEVPGPAADVRLEPIDVAPPRADGRSLVEFRTAAIVDAAGNVLPDGHLVEVEVLGPRASGRLASRTIDGVARFVMVAPDRPGAVALVAHAGGVVGEPLELDFAAAISELPVRVESLDDATVVEVGPVLDAEGAVVTDGTPARITVASDGEPIDTQLIDGRATVVVADTVDVDEVTATVLGVSGTGGRS